MLKAFGIDTSKTKLRRKPTGPAPTEESPSSAAGGNGSDDTYESPPVDGDSAAAKWARGRQARRWAAGAVRPPTLVPTLGPTRSAPHEVRSWPIGLATAALASYYI